MKYRTGYFRYRQLRQLCKSYIKENAKFALGLWRWASKKDLSPLKYSVISDKQLVYLINPKCACSSIKQALNELDSNRHYPNVHILPEVILSERKKLDNTEQGYFKFTIVRNPFERIVSFYINKFERAVKTDYRFEYEDYLGGVFVSKMTFSEMISVICGIPPYLANNHFRSQSDLIDSTGHVLDFIGRLENIDTDWQMLQEQFDLLSLPMANTTPPYDYRDYYDLTILELVNNYYQEDILRFGYTDSYHEIKAYLSKDGAKSP